MRLRCLMGAEGKGGCKLENQLGNESVGLMLASAMLVGPAGFRSVVISVSKDPNYQNSKWMHLEHQWNLQ